MGKLFILFALGFLGVSSKPTSQQIRPNSCGYETCHPVDSKKINVHLIPHSHDDVGWLKTVDQYFYGANIPIQIAGVQYIITTAVEALRRNKDRRYIQVETAFFKKWWTEAPEDLRQDFIALVNNGQIEMINGGISMNDEACTNYQSTIDQFTWGFRFLNDTLGACGIPKIGWQIDPFGHSREQASLFTQLGFEAFYFSRLDENDRYNRKAHRRMDFLWQSSASLENSEIFGSIFPTSLYSPPANLNWDVGDTNEPIIDDRESPDYNVPKFLNTVQNTINEYKHWFDTNNILLPMGGDFQYQSAEMQFMNMDKLIKIFKNNSDINVIYSTPSCYAKAVNDANPTLELKTDDFFPYSDSGHEYWVGYFTSRPNLKRFERIGNNILQGTKQLTAFAKILNGIDYTEDINILREEMGIMQHHDAITGTQKQHVTSDYIRRLTKGIRIAQSHMDEVVGSLMALNSKKSLDVDLQSCLLANISICNTGEGNNIIVVYNPIAQLVTTYIRIPVPAGNYKLITPNWEETNYAIMPPISNFAYVDASYGTPKPNEMVIEVKNLPALSAKVFLLEITPTKENEVNGSTSKKAQLKFGSSMAGFEIDSKTNLLKSVTINGKTIEITQEFLYYQSTNDPIWSGAYLFRPQEDTVAKSLSDNVVIESTTTTDLVDEVVQVFNSYIKQIIRVYKGYKQEFVEFDWLVGPLPDDDSVGMGREIITRFKVKDFNNKNVFYTDSNGRELIKRELNSRPDYKYESIIEPIASNYYPVTSRILIRDEIQNLEVAVLNDRSQAGTSLKNGELELMVHRRLFQDDYKGVNENLNEMEFGQGVVARGSHLLTLGELTPTSTNHSTAFIERTLALQKLLSPLVLIGRTDKTSEEIGKDFDLKINIITDNVPVNINILTFEPWKDNSYILRLEHLFEANEDFTFSTEVTIDINRIFANIKFSSIKETTLGANQWLAEYSKVPKFTWKSKQGRTSGWSVDTTKDNGPIITLSPMQIRTFIVEV